jgi:hypothetical protein
MSQADQVIDHINKWGSINSIQAIQQYGITRLARVIHDIKGTPNAMKAIKDDQSSEGFVKYVPDHQARHKIVIDTLIDTLTNHNLHPRYKAHACLDAASLFTTSYLVETEQ